MNQEELIEYSKKLGADVVVKKFDGSNDEIVSIFVGSTIEPILGIQGWENVIFLNQSDTFWQIGFSQAGKTRALNDNEVKYLLQHWIKNPTNEIFKNYEIIE